MLFKLKVCRCVGKSSSDIDHMALGDSVQQIVSTFFNSGTKLAVSLKSWKCCVNLLETSF